MVRAYRRYGGQRTRVFWNDGDNPDRITLVAHLETGSELVRGWTIHMVGYYYEL